MTKSFDATTRDLIEIDPGAWIDYLGISVPDRGRIEAIDADVSTINAQADKVLRVSGDHPCIIHVELQAARDPRIAERLLRYNVLLGYRHRVPVRSALVLLRPKADSPRTTGSLETALPGGDVYLQFRYNVVRAWKHRAEDVLAGGLATLPLAAISDVGSMGISGTFAAMARRLSREASPDRRAMLLNSAWVLMGLRYGKAQANQIWEGIVMDVLKIRGIEESSTYQQILQQGWRKGEAEGKIEGKIEGVRDTLIRLGTRRFGPPSKAVRTKLKSLDDPRRLIELSDRLLDVATWEELFSR